jgi:hypothetical protein
MYNDLEPVTCLDYVSMPSDMDIILNPESYISENGLEYWSNYIANDLSRISTVMKTSYYDDIKLSPTYKHNKGKSKVNKVLSSRVPTFNIVPYNKLENVTYNSILLLAKLGLDLSTDFIKNNGGCNGDIDICRRYWINTINHYNILFIWLRLSSTFRLGIINKYKQTQAYNCSIQEIDNTCFTLQNLSRLSMSKLDKLFDKYIPCLESDYNTTKQHHRIVNELIGYPMTSWINFMPISDSIIWCKMVSDIYDGTTTL